MKACSHIVLHMAFLSKHPYIIMRFCLFLFVFFILLFPFFFQGNVFSRQAFISIRWYFVSREVQVSSWSPGNSRWDIFHPQTFLGLADHPFFSSLAAWLNRLCRKAVIVINIQHPLHLSPVGYYREFIFFFGRRPSILSPLSLKKVVLKLSNLLFLIPMNSVFAKLNAVIFSDLRHHSSLNTV